MNAERSVEGRIAQLRAAPLFADLPEPDLRRLADVARLRRVPAGDLLIEEGTPGDCFFVIASGELEVSRETDGVELPLARVGPGAVQGEMAALEGGERTASVRAITDVDALWIPAAALRELVGASPDAAVAIVRTIAGRLRSTEALLSQREKLAALGTLAAGLAHELNNPAAAISRSAAALGEVLEARSRAAAVLSADSPRLARLVTAAPPPPAAPLRALERADRTDALASVLRRLGASRPDAMAASLADAGWTGDSVSAALDGYRDGAEVDAALAWLESVASAGALLGEVRMAAERIGEIVRAVKAYAYLDQAPVQRIDVRRSLDDTLVILRHRLKGGVSVTKEYADDLPEIEAYGSELNQAWTNIIDNATDAMGGRGELLVRAEPVEVAGDTGVRVTICDSGPGIPADVVPRLFEPFFTTKPPGVGTGLGLHISHSAVVRQGGRIDVESRPGRTCFVVTLPPRIPKREVARPGR
ncbi:MAG TPA: ATP-binding protein [Candidatus Limnocylindria bacterium]|nr:ATP-binding protein [Candidatus Limnocylindria bacterium]